MSAFFFDNQKISCIIGNGKRQIRIFVDRIKKDALQKYLRAFGMEKVLEMSSLGRGAHGEGWLVRAQGARGQEDFVIKSVRPSGLGHDYPSDRAGMFLLALDTYNGLPAHVKALDVLGLQDDGSLKSVGGGKEYYLLMAKAAGTSYFEDLEQLVKKDSLAPGDRLKIDSLVSYLADIHSLKKTSKELYLRKLRDIIGHGECLMGVFDTYPGGAKITPGEMASIEKKCIDWRAKLKSKFFYRRLCRVHGDFHPGNIRFHERASGGKRPRPEFTLLDRSRGPWGEPADDLTALAINFIFYSVKKHGRVRGACLEGLNLFFEKYIRLTGDDAVLGVAAPFFAFRGAVVANPVFYPLLDNAGRRLIFRFIHGVLDSPAFDPARVNDYISS